MRLALCLGFIALLVCCCGVPEKNASVAAVQDAGAAAAAVVTGSAGASADRQQQDLLKWALGHADPEALRQQAQAAKQASSRDAAERQVRVQQLIKAVSSAPTEAQLMKQAGSILANASMPEDRMLAAMEAMTYLVEDLDNANQMHQLGVLQPVIDLLGHALPHVRAASARCVRAAAANNALFQKTLLEQHPDVLTSLMTLLAGADEQAAAAALAALGAVLRNSGAARGAFYLGAGLPHLQLLLRDGRRPLRLRRTALGLLTDLLQEDAEPLAAATAKGTAAGLDAPAAVHAALQLLAHPEADRDLQEKALLLLQLLLEREPEASGLLAEAGAATQLAELQAELQAAIAATGGGGSTGMDSDDGGGGYLQELAALVAAVQRSMAGRDGVQQLHTEL